MGEGDVRIFPGAPPPRRVIADGGIGVKQQRGVRIGQRQVPQCVGHGCGEPVPLAGEDADGPETTTRRTGTANAKSRRGKCHGGLLVSVRAFASHVVDHEEVSVLGRPGSDLLFQVLRLSTIGAGKFYGRVRDGIGYRLPANTTRPAKDG